MTKVGDGPLCVEFLVEMFGTVQQSSVPGDIPTLGGEDVSGVETSVQELSLADLTHIWTLGVGSDRSLIRPKEWNGESHGFDDFAFKFVSWLSGLPGDAERLLEESSHMGRQIVFAGTAREGCGKSCSNCSH